MGEPRVGVIGAGIIGCAVAWALAREGHRVILIDRSDPATAGASFGNAGHVATEQLEPLPSTRLLLTFWRQLFALGGPLELPPHRLVQLSPWILGFAKAAFRQKAHARYLGPLVRVAADTLEGRLREVGRLDLLRRHGHYEVWLGPSAAARASAAAKHAAALGTETHPIPSELLDAVARNAGHTGPAAGSCFPGTAHVVDPMAVAHAFASAARQRGATFRRAHVKHLQSRGDGLEIVTDSEALPVRTAVVCTGVWSRSLLQGLGVNAPLEAERGYHVELPGGRSLVDAPLLYADHSILVTPMNGRLRASSYLEFAGLNAPPDPRKPARLRARLHQLGYECPADGPSWMGPRPTLPDYLPGIGRARDVPGLLYAIGHQHLGLTLAAVSADLIADLVAGRAPRLDVRAFDLDRFQ